MSTRSIATISNLSKPFFWDSVQIDYPTAVQSFYSWIDEYKQEVGWGKMFGDVKFHDLPLEMQVGVLARYKHEVLRAEPVEDNHSLYYKDMRLECAMDNIRALFKQVEKRLHPKSLTEMVIN